MTSLDGFDLPGWADALGYAEFPIAAGDLVCVGDHEVAWYLAERDGMFLAEVSDRGSRRGLASSSAVGPVLRAVMLEMGRAARSARGLRAVDAAAPADVEIEEGPTAFHLRWDDAWADVPRGLLADRRARLLARAVRRPADDLAESLTAPSGAPLFRAAGPGR